MVYILFAANGILFGFLFNLWQTLRFAIFRWHFSMLDRCLAVLKWLHTHLFFLLSPCFLTNPNMHISLLFHSFFRSREKSVRDSFSDFVLFKEKFWHDKSVVYHHLVGFIHFYIRSLRCHFRVFRVQFLFIFRSWASCFTSPLVCYPIRLASFPLFLCVVVVVVCTVFFCSLFHSSRMLLDKLIFKLLPDYQVVVCLPHI